ncbi:PadR family transcriptional regulator [Paenibacillus lentus]|uniref:PadR family transcriptional regulator n=1 Tax=Paenibacillus lentus TaxID=1338368 RepID=A0A3Q8SB30_9BACL|nr:PadR family transcriptional regulator [Paenibacillus lentus]AZK46464.1 PadR family transcriptional regulator [Paenibacillus lentus]
MSDTASQLKKGVLEILVLYLLSRSDLYGYQLIIELDIRSHGYFKVKEGTLYPVLYRLEDSRHIESYWERDDGKRGVRRKYYRITASGGRRLAEMKQELALFFGSIKQVLEVDDGERD